MEEIKKRILSNTFINIVGKGLSVGVQVVLLAFLVRSLGEARYGIFVLGISLFMLSNIFEAGLGIGLVRHVAHLNARGDRKNLEATIRAYFLLIASITAGFTILIYGFRNYLPVVLKLDPQAARALISLTGPLIIYIIGEMAYLSFSRVLEGFQEYLLLRKMEIAKWMLRLIFVVSFVIYDPLIQNIFLAYALSTVLSLALFHRSWRKALNLQKQDRPLPGLSHFIELLKFALPINIRKVAAFLAYRADVFLISIFVNTVAITYYYIAFKLYEVVGFVMSLCSSVVIPATSEIAAKHDTRVLKRLYLKGTKYTLIVIGPLIVFAFGYSSQLLKMWVGDIYDATAGGARLFLVALLISSLTHYGNEMLVGMGKLRKPTVVILLSSVINFIISLALVQRMGFLGPIVGVLAGSLINSLWVGRIIFKVLDIELREFAGQMGKVLFLLAILLLALLLVDSPYLAILFVGVSYLLLFYLAVEDSDRNFVIENFGNMKMARWKELW